VPTLAIFSGNGCSMESAEADKRRLPGVFWLAESGIFPREPTACEKRTLGSVGRAGRSFRSQLHSGWSLSSSKQSRQGESTGTGSDTPVRSPTDYLTESRRGINMRSGRWSSIGRAIVEPQSLEKVYPARKKQILTLPPPGRNETWVPA
jgi:hypothetical protein